MPPSGDEDEIPKKNAWICWFQDELGYIIDLNVYEIDRSMPWRCEKTVDYVTRKCQEKGIVFRDCGCVNSDWNDWRLSDLLFKFGLQYGFNDRNIMIKCMKNLARIREFKEDIYGWLKYIE